MPLWTTPTKPASGGGSAPAGTTPGSTSGSGSSSSGSGSSASSTYKQQQANAARRYREQSAHLEAQAKALQHALRVDFKHNLLQNLSDVTDVLKAQQRLVREGYNRRYGQLAGAAEDNEMAHGDQTAANAENASRERGAAITQAMSQGAGESDTIAAMMMSLRNWNANQSEVERTNADTLRSINSSLTDLNVDTKTALANNQIQANADREQLWTNYFNQMSTTYTNLGNIRTSQADYGSMAREMGGGGGGKKSDKAGGAADGGGGHKSRNRPLGAAARDRVSVQEESSVGRPALGATSLMRGGVIPTAPKPPATTGGSTPGTHASDGGGTRTSGGGSGSSGSGGGGRSGGDGGNGRAFHQAASAFMQASKMAGKSWNNPGVSDKVMDWRGHRQFENHSNMGRLQPIGDLDLGKPEGATLRKWDS